jgi:hypothetical protein
MSDKIIELLKEILDDMKHYRTRKNFASLIHTLYVNSTKKDDLFESIIENIILSTNELNDKELIKIEKILYSYVIKNRKKYISKITNND